MRRSRGAWPLAALAAAALGLPAAAAQQRNLDAYASRLAVYRSGDFPAALRASMEVPFRRLRDQAEEFLGGFRAPAPEADHRLLAAAMLHFDLAWAGEMEPGRNEELGRRLLARVTAERRGGWLRDAHLGLLGAYTDRGQLDAAVRVGRFLKSESPDDPEVRLQLARLAEFIGWGIHDERFLAQAQDDYQRLLDEGVGDPIELRLRIAHLTLREGNPEEALRRIGESGDALSARHRFVAQLLRGETLLWLDQPAAAEAAFREALAIHMGSVSAAAGLAAARQTLGDGERAAEAVRSFLSATTGQDSWWHFLFQELADEAGRLDALRGQLVLPPG